MNIDQVINKANTLKSMWQSAEQLPHIPTLRVDVEAPNNGDSLLELCERQYWRSFNEAVDYLVEHRELEIPQSADARMTQEIHHRRGQVNN